MGGRPWSKPSIVMVVLGLLVSGCAPVATTGSTPAQETASYIVSLRDGAGDVERVAADLVRRHGGRVDRLYRHALRGFSATLTAGDARRIVADPAVARVEADGWVRATASPPSGVVAPAAMADVTLDYGRDRIDQRDERMDGQFRYTATGDGVHVYILSTGINIGHNEFGGRASYGWDFVDNDATAAPEGRCGGEGTGYASLIAGATTLSIAKLARPVAVRIRECGDTAVSTVLAGVDWVTQNAMRPAVVFLPWYEEWSAGPYATLGNAIENSVNSGLTYVVPAGSHAPAEDSCRMFPARLPSVIAISATGTPRANMRRADDANTGGCVTLFAPNGGYLGASSDNLHDYTLYLSEHAISAAYVAGVAAMVLGVNPGWTASEVRSALVADATTGAVIDPGLGAPNRFLHSWPGVNLTCESRRSRIHCSITAADSVLSQIRWRLNGILIAQWADDPMVNGGCRAGTSYTIEVEATHAIGFVDTANVVVTCRSGNP